MMDDETMAPDEIRLPAPDDWRGAEQHVRIKLSESAIEGFGVAMREVLAAYERVPGCEGKATPLLLINIGMQLLDFARRNPEVVLELEAFRWVPEPSPGDATD